MENEIKEIEVKIIYGNGSVEKIKYDQLVLIAKKGTDIHVIDKIDLHFINDLFNHIDNLKKNIEERIDLKAFNQTRNLFKILDEKGVKGLESAFENGELDLSKKAFEEIKKVLESENFNYL